MYYFELLEITRLKAETALAEARIRETDAETRRLEASLALNSALHLNDAPTSSSTSNQCMSPFTLQIY
jgi:hypothetical protein